MADRRGFCPSLPKAPVARDTQGNPPPMLACAVVFLFVAACGCTSMRSGEISDAELLAYATEGYDKAERMLTHENLGLNHGTRVVADFLCADVCPDNTMRVIHYDLEEGTSCADAGGVEKEVHVPVAAAKAPKAFCIPRVLAQNWERVVW